MQKLVTVTSQVIVIVDETKFTEAWMAEFREYMFNFYTIDDHIKHLAQMYISSNGLGYNPFVEGYGLLKDMGIRFVEQPYSAFDDGEVTIEDVPSSYLEKS